MRWAVCVCVCVYLYFMKTHSANQMGVSVERVTCVNKKSDQTKHHTKHHTAPMRDTHTLPSTQAVSMPCSLAVSF